MWFHHIAGRRPPCLAPFLSLRRSSTSMTSVRRRSKRHTCRDAHDSQVVHADAWLGVPESLLCDGRTAHAALPCPGRSQCGMHASSHWRQLPSGPASYERTTRGHEYNRTNAPTHHVGCVCMGAGHPPVCTASDFQRLRRVGVEPESHVAVPNAGYGSCRRNLKQHLRTVGVVQCGRDCRKHARRGLARKHDPPQHGVRTSFHNTRQQI